MKTPPRMQGPGTKQGSGTKKSIKALGILDLSIEELATEETQAACRIWHQKCRGRALPHLRDLDPMDLRGLLPYLSVIEVLDGEPPDYLYRLEGEAVVAALGYRRAGRCLSELQVELGDSHWQMTRLFGRICATAQPFVGKAVLSMLKREFYEIEWAYLPFADEAGRVKRILCCIGIIARPEDVAKGPPLAT